MAVTPTRTSNPLVNKSSAYCSTCQAVFKDFWYAELYSSHVHHKGFNSLYRSARTEACEICVRLMSAFVEELHRKNISEFIHFLCFASEVPGFGLPNCTTYSYRSVLCGGHNIEIKFSQDWVKRVIPELMNAFGKGVCSVAVPVNRFWDRLRGISEPEDWRPGPSLELLEQPLGNSSGSAETFKLVRTWLDDCKQHHPRCNVRDEVSWLPTRVLDLGSQEDFSKIRVCVTSEENFTVIPEYTTLSHRWPVDHEAQLKLTSDNIDRLKKNVGLEELPKTFCDAIKISKQLGIQYLWIDSLCIKQDDDKGDWKHESSLMAKVYKNSTINISASAAADGNYGCFRDRESFLPPLRTSKPANGDRPEELHIVLPNLIWMGNVEMAGIQQRGWVLQERVLSPRVLHYAMEEVFWECRQFCACESIPFGIDPCFYNVGIGDSFIKDFTPGLALEGYGHLAWNAHFGSGLLKISLLAISPSSPTCSWHYPG